MWKEMKIFPNKQKYRMKDQNVMRGYTDPNGEGAACAGCRKGS